MTDYLVFDFVLLAVVFPSLPPALLLEADELFVFAAVEDLPLFAEPAALDFSDFVLLADAVPVVLLFAADFFEPSLSSRSPTASAAMLSALKAAPVAAPVRISPATSLAVSKTGDSCLRVVFFDADFAALDDLADFVSFALDFAGAEVFFGDADFDFAEVEVFVVVFELSFFAAIFYLPFFEI